MLSISLLVLQHCLMRWVLHALHEPKSHLTQNEANILKWFLFTYKVLEQARNEFLDYSNTGSSVMGKKRFCFTQ